MNNNHTPIDVNELPIDTALQLIFNEFSECCIPGKDAMRYGATLQLFAQTINRVRAEVYTTPKESKPAEKAPAKADKPTK